MSQLRKVIVVIGLSQTPVEVPSQMTGSVCVYWRVHPAEDHRGPFPSVNENACGVMDGSRLRRAPGHPNNNLLFPSKAIRDVALLAQLEQRECSS